MTLFIVLGSALVLSLLIYIFFPVLKKSLFNRSGKERKKRVKREKPQKENKKLDSRVEVMENKGDLFSEDFDKKIEDPDKKVNYDNFDFDGLFDNDFNSKIKINEESDKKEDSIYEENFEEMFNKYFSGDKPKKSNSIRNVKYSNSQSEDELYDMLRQNIGSDDENEFRRQFESMSDEMKALMLSNFLERKDS